VTAAATTPRLWLTPSQSPLPPDVMPSRPCSSAPSVRLRADLVGPGLALGAPLAFLANMLPLTPWGIGVGETALASLLRLAEHTGGGELMLAWRLLMLVPALCGLVVYLRGQRRWVRPTGDASLT